MAKNPLYTRFMETILDFTKNFIKAFNPSDHRIHDDQDHAAIYAAIKEKDEKIASYFLVIGIILPWGYCKLSCCVMVNIFLVISPMRWI